MALYSNPDKVKKAFIENGKPFFVVYSLKDAVNHLRVNADDDDINSAADNLNTWLKGIEYTGQLNIYAFDKFPNKLTKAAIDGATLITYQFKNVYTPEQKEEYYQRRNQVAGTDPALIAILDRMEQREAAAHERLEKIERLVQEMAESEDDEEIEDKTENNVLGAVLGNPAVQNLLVAFATNLGANLVSNNQQRPVGLAGIVDENSEVNELVEKLFSKGLTIDHLRKLADMPALKIKSLLLML